MARTDERGGPRTRARIAETASGMFLRRGFEQVTVAEVAREAGVSSVTVFKHFPRKEDLFFDRSTDAADALRAAVRDRAPGVDVLASLQDAALQLAESRHPLSALAAGAGPFFETVAASPSLVSHARGLAADLERTLREELEHDPTSTADAALLAAVFMAAYGVVLTSTAHRVIAGESPEDLVDAHRAHLRQVCATLRSGVLGSAPP